MTVQYSKRFSHAFVIDGSKLKKLTELLKNRVSNVSVSAGCVDGMSYEFKTVEDLIAYENPKSKKIVSIKLYAESEDFSRSARISFVSQGFPTGILIEVTGNEDIISRLRDEILDIIKGTRPLYDMLSRFPYGYSAGIGILIGLIVRIYLKRYLTETFEEEAENIARLLMYASTLLIMYPVYKLLCFCFPKGCFAIGQGKSRFNSLKWFRGIIATLIISSIFFIMRYILN